MSIDFDTFTQEHYGSIVRTVALAIGDARAAEDATQEAFIKASVRWRRIQRMDRPAGWVHVVAVNAARRALKHQSLRVTSTNQSPSPMPSVADHAAGVATRLSVRAALAELPPKQRAAVVLRYLGDLSVEDTAKALGVSEGTIKSTTHDALAGLRVSMEGLSHE